MSSGLFPTFQRFRLFHYAGLAAVGVVPGMVVGALVGALNGWISPEFVVILMYFGGLPLPSLPVHMFASGGALGIGQGICAGAITTALYAASVFVISGARAQFQFAVVYLNRLLQTALICWFVSGFNGLLGALLVDHFQPDWTIYFLGGGRLNIYTLKLAWAASSHAGLVGGLLLGLVMAIVSFQRAWRVERDKEYAALTTEVEAG